jgi:hypothetical protein
VSDELSEFRRGQNRTIDAMWDRFNVAELMLEDPSGLTDPLTRAVLAVVRSQLQAMVDSIGAEWECDERVERVRDMTARLAAADALTRQSRADGEYRFGG